MTPQTAAALVDALCAHLKAYVESYGDVPADVNTLFFGIKELDQFLTGRTGSLCIVRREDIAKFVADPGYSSNNIIYLSDGGYSRLVLPTYPEHRKPFVIGLVGPPTAKVQAKWEEVMAYTKRAELWEGR